MTAIIQVGAGGFGAQYLQGLVDHPCGQLVAIVDVNPDSIPSHLRSHFAHVPLYNRLDQALTEQAADVAVLASPTPFHYPQMQQAVNAGLHVLCEKPLAANDDDALAMLAIDADSDQCIRIGYQWGFSTAFSKLKDYYHTGRLGQPQSLDTLVLWPRTKGYYNRGAWAGERVLPDGTVVNDSPLANATAHFLWAALDLLGDDVHNIHAQLWRANNIGNYDAVAMAGTIADVPIHYFSAHCVPAPVGPIFRWCFERATVCYHHNGDGELYIIWNDGRRESLGNPNVSAGLKLKAFIDGLDGSCRGATIASAARHTGVVTHLATLPIAQLGGVREQDLGDDVLVYHDGLASGFMAAFAHGCLPTHLPGLGDWNT